MKLRSIGSSYPDVWTGLMLTPSEYLEHPGYHQMCGISSDTLFIATDSELSYPYPCINAVSVDRSSSFALLEATEEERARLLAAGYKMLNLDSRGSHACSEF